jgi:hypothetical protein
MYEKRPPTTASSYHGVVYHGVVYHGVVYPGHGNAARLRAEWS